MGKNETDGRWKVTVVLGVIAIVVAIVMGLPDVLTYLETHEDVRDSLGVALGALRQVWLNVLWVGFLCAVIGVRRLRNLATRALVSAAGLLRALYAGVLVVAARPVRDEVVARLAEAGGEKVAARLTSEAGIELGVPSSECELRMRNLSSQSRGVLQYVAAEYGRRAGKAFREDLADPEVLWSPLCALKEWELHEVLEELTEAGLAEPKWEGTELIVELQGCLASKGRAAEAARWLEGLGEE
jgi:hypothetical protein